MITDTAVFPLIHAIGKDFGIHKDFGHRTNPLSSTLPLGISLGTQMGHSSINVTMDTYGHLMKAVNQDAVKRLDAAVFWQNGDFLGTSKGKGLTSLFK
jgi:hypothetical protein